MLVVSFREGNSKLKQKDQLHKYLRYVFPSQENSHTQDYYLFVFFKHLFLLGNPYKPSFATVTGRGGGNPRETTYRVFFLGGFKHHLKRIKHHLKRINITLKGLNITLKGLNITLKGLNITLKWLNITLKGLNITLKGLTSP